MRIAIMGAGSLGTILGAYVSKAGYDVVLIDPYQEHVDALNKDGAHVNGITRFPQNLPYFFTITIYRKVKLNRL